MPSRLPLIALLTLLPLCVAAGYGLRFAFLEDSQWVGLCAEQAQRWECQLRTGLGLMIHFRLLAWSALAAALAGFLLSERAGWWLAFAGLCLGIPALLLYTASLAVFAVVIAGLRLVRR